MAASALVSGVVDLLVGLGRAIPGKILSHRLRAHAGDGTRAVVPCGKRPADDVVESPGGEVVEDEARSGSLQFVVLNHSIGKPAGRADDGKRSIAQAVELVEA